VSRGKSCRGCEGVGGPRGGVDCPKPTDFPFPPEPAAELHPPLIARGVRSIIAARSRQWSTEFVPGGRVAEFELPFIARSLSRSPETAFPRRESWRRWPPKDGCTFNHGRRAIRPAGVPTRYPTALRNRGPGPSLLTFGPRRGIEPAASGKGSHGQIWAGPAKPCILFWGGGRILSHFTGVREAGPCPRGPPFCVPIGQKNPTAIYEVRGPARRSPVVRLQRPTE